MGTLKQFAGKLVFVDTMPFIYHIEEHPVYVETVEAFFVGALRDKHYRLMTSVITLGEVLVQPYRKGNDVLVAEYEGIICGTDDLLVMPRLWSLSARLLHASSAVSATTMCAPACPSPADSAPSQKSPLVFPLASASMKERWAACRCPEHQGNKRRFLWVR